MEKYFVYFIKSKKNQKIYVGYTAKDPQDRLREHNLGANNFTSLNRPYFLCYYEEYQCKKDAMMRERYYKTGLGKQIKKIIVEYMGKITKLDL